MDSDNTSITLSNSLFERILYFPYVYVAAISTIQPEFFVNLKFDVLPWSNYCFLRE